MKDENKLALISVVALLDLIFVFAIFSGAIIGIFQKEVETFKVYVLAGRIALFAIGFFVFLIFLINQIDKIWEKRKKEKAKKLFKEFNQSK